MQVTNAIQLGHGLECISLTEVCTQISPTTFKILKLTHISWGCLFCKIRAGDRAIKTGFSLSHANSARHDQKRRCKKIKYAKLYPKYL